MGNVSEKPAAGRENEQGIESGTFPPIVRLFPDSFGFTSVTVVCCCVTRGRMRQPLLLLQTLSALHLKGQLTTTPFSNENKGDSDELNQIPLCHQLVSGHRLRHPPITRPATIDCSSLKVAA